MKAISLYQPWASLIAVGAKKFETRSWPTKHRGQIAIHAGKKKPTDILTKEDVHFVRKAAYALGMEGGFNIYDVLNRLNTLPLGAIVATADLVGCWHTFGRTEIVCNGILAGSRPGRINDFVSDDELVFGDFSVGRFAWELENVKILDKPIPVKGMQGLWNWSEEGL